jgi:hypothetical protein
MILPVNEAVCSESFDRGEEDLVSPIDWRHGRNPAVVLMSQKEGSHFDGL